MLTRIVPLALLATLFVAGCDSEGDFSTQVVVESYLQAGEPLTRVRLSRTDELNAVYDFTRLSERNATVSVSLLAEDGSVEATYPYAERADLPGIYEPVEEVTVLPLRTYLLEADTRTAGPVRARTLVPDTFNLVGKNADTLVYQGPVQLELEATRSFYPGRQNVFIFNTLSLEPIRENLTPFAREFLDDESDEELEDFALGDSPLLNEANYTINPEGTVAISLPWLAVIFTGPTVLSASALDDNLIDFISSQEIQGGGATSPGEIPDILDRVENGTGVFGSYSRVESGLVMILPE